MEVVASVQRALRNAVDVLIHDSLSVFVRTGTEQMTETQAIVQSAHLALPLMELSGAD